MRKETEEDEIGSTRENIRFRERKVLKTSEQGVCLVHYMGLNIWKGVCYENGMAATKMAVYINLRSNK